MNPCANGDPQQGPNNRPLQCRAGGASTCGAGFYCHYGAVDETTVCCPGSLPPDCSGYPAQEGQGNSSLPRWFFNMETQLCEAFIYRGIYGNPNNFFTQEDCEARCPVFENPCADPLPSKYLIKYFIKHFLELN